MLRVALLDPADGGVDTLPMATKAMARRIGRLQPDTACIRVKRGAAVGLAIVFLCALLSACGTEAARASGASGATAVSRGAVRTTVPSSPASPAFRARADAVQRAVRAAGVPAPPSGIFLYSSRTPGLAFDTTEQKLAWSAGQVVLAPGIQLEAAGDSHLDFADGSSLPVNVLGARTALAGQVGSTPSNCRGLAAAAYTLTVTSASLRTADVVTSRGPATVPAWSFTAKGLSRSIVVIAVSNEVLKPRFAPVPPPGLAELPLGLLGVDDLTRVEGNTLIFNVLYGGCETDLHAHVVEFDDMVVVGGSYGPRRADTCGLDVEHRSAASVTLATPLGDRAVISAATGVRLIPL
ncbi:hypothetical protein ACFV9C_38200 [Kribbella sp. NPDC059898]|uniref:hypothetical protein n=1 Tax=Kribbella sp. NPDC059898 TaxID=3346995 RepID=UPI00366387D3